MQSARRMVKKAVKRGRRSTARRIMSATFVDAGEPAVLEGERFILTRPPEPAETGSFPVAVR